MTANHQPQEAADVRDVTRRKVVAVGAGAVAAVGLGGSAYALSEKPGAPRKPAPAEDCYALTSETTEGPYYIDADKIRRDVTEDRPGIPFLLKVKVIDNETCRPIRDAAVDIWHCDAVGVYSGYEDMGSGGGPAPTGTPTDTPTGPPPGGGGGHQEPTDDTRYLRGTWRADRHGFVGAVAPVVVVSPWVTTAGRSPAAPSSSPRAAAERSTSTAASPWAAGCCSLRAARGWSWRRTRGPGRGGCRRRSTRRWRRGRRGGRLVRRLEGDPERLHSSSAVTSGAEYRIYAGGTASGDETGGMYAAGGLDGADEIAAVTAGDAPEGGFGSGPRR